MYAHRTAPNIAGTPADQLLGSGDGHKSHYPWDFVNFYQENDRRGNENVRYEQPVKSHPRRRVTKDEHKRSYHCWGAEIEKSPPTVDYNQVMETSGGEKGVASLTNLIVSDAGELHTRGLGVPSD